MATRARSRRDAVARFVAPALFLLAVTVLVLLIKSGVSGGNDTPKTEAVSTAAATTSGTRTTPERIPPQKPKKRYYVIAAGDTFGTVAAKFGTTVEALQALNPGISSNSLSVGQRIRVK